MAVLEFVLGIQGGARWADILFATALSIVALLVGPVVASGNRPDLTLAGVLLGFVAGVLVISTASGDRGELEDLVQEVFVIAFRGLANFRHEAQLATWLYRICVNVAFGRIRSRGRRPPPIRAADLEQASTQSKATERPDEPRRARRTTRLFRRPARSA